LRVSVDLRTREIRQEKVGGAWDYSVRMGTPHGRGDIVTAGISLSTRNYNIADFFREENDLVAVFMTREEAFRNRLI
jgi:hypothetical protein